MLFLNDFFTINGGNRIKVWQKKFLAAIKHIGKTRVSGITNRYFSSAQFPRETRGEDRVKDKNYEKKLEVTRFICRFRARESHKGRNKSIRLYLPSELCSINNVWEMYNGSVGAELEVSSSMFDQIFTSEYNIGFNGPRVDA